MNQVETNVKHCNMINSQLRMPAPLDMKYSLLLSLELVGYVFLQLVYYL
jgi:hypothetical protein